jgi:hypothetical protein
MRFLHLITLPLVHAVPSSNIRRDSGVALTIPAAAYSEIVSVMDQPAPTPVWAAVSCSQTDISNAAAQPQARWEAADVANAWNAAIESWNSSSTSLPFAASISAFFNGPENLDCQDIGSMACSNTVTCSQVNHPAGSVIFNIN